MENYEPTGDRDLGVEEFLGLLARHEAQIMGFIWSITWSEADAEDLFQQSVLTMWQKRTEFKPDTNFVAWGCQIAKYKAFESSRKTKKELLLDQDVIERLAVEQGQEDFEERLVRRRALGKCLHKLSEKDRRLIELRYESGQSISQAAECMGRSARSIYKSLARIRKLLFNCMQATLRKEGI